MRETSCQCDYPEGGDEVSRCVPSKRVTFDEFIKREYITLGDINLVSYPSIRAYIILPRYLEREYEHYASSARSDIETFLTKHPANSHFYIVIKMRSSIEMISFKDVAKLSSVLHHTLFKSVESIIRCYPELGKTCQYSRKNDGHDLQDKLSSHFFKKSFELSYRVTYVTLHLEIIKRLFQIKKVPSIAEMFRFKKSYGMALDRIWDERLLPHLERESKAISSSSN